MNLLTQLAQAPPETPADRGGHLLLIVGGLIAALIIGAILLVAIAGVMAGGVVAGPVVLAVGVVGYILTGDTWTKWVIGAGVLGTWILFSMG